MSDIFPFGGGALAHPSNSDGGGAKPEVDKSWKGDLDLRAFLLNKSESR